MCRKRRKGFLSLAILIAIINLVLCDPGPYLLYANKRDIRLVKVQDLDRRTAKKTTVVIPKPLNEAVSLDFILQENRLCWTELSKQAIKCAQIRPNNKAEIVKETLASTDVMSPEGLACDWVNRMVYWTDSDTKRIEVAVLHEQPTKEINLGMKLALRKTIIWEDLDLPRAIAVAPQEGLMFWSDWGVLPRLGRCSMDGDVSTRQVLVDSNIDWPNGITLDYQERRLYWVDAKLDVIGSVDWEGRDRRRLRIEKSALPEPFAISIFENVLYWTDWEINSINVYNMSSHVHQTMRLRGKSDPMDIKVFQPGRQPNVTSPCQIDNGGCSHLCLAAENKGGYSCACPSGLTMVNNRTCSKSFSSLMIIALQGGLKTMSLDTKDYTERTVVLDQEYQNTMNTVDVDFDPVESKIYWTDQDKGIFRAGLNGEDLEPFIDKEVFQLDSLAVDWQARNLYWTDTGSDNIEVARLDDPTIRKVIVSKGLDEPRAIVLDQAKGFLYWTDWGKKPGIGKAWMDGSHQGIVVEKDIGWPNGLALDLAAQKLYWCDAMLDRIEIVNVDGSGRKILIQNTLPHPFGLTLLDEFVYWTDWNEKVIQKARKDDGTERTILVAHLKELMGVHASKTSVIWPDPSNECSVNNGGCQHLCLRTPGGKRCQCAEALGFELHDDGVSCVVPEAYLLYTRDSTIGRISMRPNNEDNYKLPLRDIKNSSSLDFDSRDSRIYWTDIGDTTISRGFLNGSQSEVIVEFGLGYPEGLAVDWNAGNLYWTDLELGQISVSRTTGSSRRVLIWRDLIRPMSIALNPNTGIMYWSSWGEVPVIEQANFDGSDRRIFRKDGVGMTNGLTIDFETARIYWSDLDQKTISYAFLQASLQATKTVVSETNLPYSLSLYRNHIYWTDWESSAIFRANKDTGKDVTLIQTNISQVHDVLVYHESRQKGSNVCSSAHCSDLCLFVNGGVKCACPDHHDLSSDKSECVPPTDFILFGTKHKISRLVGAEDTVPHVVLPIREVREVRNLGFDPVHRIVYWIDVGKHFKTDDEVVERVFLKRAFDNGTLIDKVELSENPVDMVVDPVARVILWSSEITNTINVTKLGARDDREEGSGIVVGWQKSGKMPMPRKMAVHSTKGIIFWTDVSALGSSLERCLLNGDHRRTIVHSNDVIKPTDVAIDQPLDRLYWSDVGSHVRIQSSDLQGQNRQILLEDDYLEPTSIAILSQEVFFVSGEAVYKFDKESKVVHSLASVTVVQKGIKHLSPLLAVRIDQQLMSKNPCLVAGCSHLCLLSGPGRAECACPTASGLVLNGEQTCGFPPTCKPDEFTCKRGSLVCIPLQWRCDGQKECSDHSDEIDCPECGPGTFRCRSGQCINTTMLCNGNKDCDDNTDELSCCSKQEFRCPRSGQCIPNRLTCDGHKDCEDGADEIWQDCRTNAEGSASQFEEDQGNAVVIAPVVLILVVIITIAIVILVVYRRRKRTKVEEAQQDQVDRNPLTMQRDNLITSTLPRDHISRDLMISGTLPRGLVYHESAPPPSQYGVFDRPSDITGRSSSSSANNGYHHHHYVRSQPVSKYMHNNTPCATDVNDDSEVYADVGRQIPSVASSVCDVDSEVVVNVMNGNSEYLSFLDRAPPPSPTKEYEREFQVGDGDEEEDENS